MKESIYTIPINEIFEKKCGCPICSMQTIFEQRSVEYILGGAMMEPDIRIETNELGFCERHYVQMLGQKDRLSMALTLESHLAHIKKDILKGKVGIIKTAPAKKAEKLSNTCFVCDHVNGAMESALNNILDMYSEKDEFRELFSEQEAFCLPHYQLLCISAEKRLSKENKNALIKAATRIASEYLDRLSQDVSKFCRMFDYRNSGGDTDWGTSKDSIERAVWFLTSHKE